MNNTKLYKLLKRMNACWNQYDLTSKGTTLKEIWKATSLEDRAWLLSEIKFLKTPRKGRCPCESCCPGLVSELKQRRPSFERTKKAFLKYVKENNL